ncbi:MAG: hypothetical protein E7395_06080 [Ruminococcaceae bacterium]|nr:hypothetical protein [Oscillospiraceae bacterium]
MKKLLALLLSVMMIFSTVGVFAEETTTTEETLTGGYFTNNATTPVSSKSFSETFTNASAPSRYYVDRFGDESYYVYMRRAGTFSSSSDKAARSEVLSENPVSENNQYFKLKDVAGDGGYNPHFGFKLSTSDIAQTEKVDISFYLRADDAIYNKAVFFAKHTNCNESDRKDLVEMNPNGTFSLLDNTTETEYKVGQWYKFDITLDFLNQLATFCIDNTCVAEYEALNFAAWQTTDNYLYYFGFSIPTASSDDTYDSSVSIDDITITVSDAVLIEPEPEYTYIGSMNGEVVDDVQSTVLYTDDYTTKPTASVAAGHTATKKGVSMNLVYATESTGIDHGIISSESDGFEPVDSESGNYGFMRVASNYNDNTAPSYLYVFNFSNMGQNEKIHFSFDARNEDNLFDKQVLFARHQKVSEVEGNNPRGNVIINMRKDGKLSFSNFDPSSLDDDYAISYELGKWYHFDIIFDYKKVLPENVTDATLITSAVGDVYYYVDGVLITTVENVDFCDWRDTGASSNNDYMKRFGYFINNVGMDKTTTRSSDSIFYFDNLKVEIIPSVEEPEFTIATPAYSLTDFAVTDFTIGQAGTITASATLANTDPTKKVTFAIATYNANNELTGIKIGATYVLSGNISLTANVAATDTCVKVFVLDDAASITPIQAATVIGTPAA